MLPVCRYKSLDSHVVRIGQAQSLEIRGKGYPVTAALEGTRLKGTFSGQGKQFPFVADLAGDSLKLTSDGSTYALNRVGAANNPLGGEAKQPENPLGFVPITAAHCAGGTSAVPI